MVVTPASYLKVPDFKSWPENQLYWGFLWVSLTPLKWLQTLNKGTTISFHIPFISSFRVSQVLNAIKPMQWKGAFQWTTHIFQIQSLHDITPAFTLVSCLPYSLTLKMEVTCSSEMSVDFQRTTLHYIPKVRTLHNHRCENFKSYAIFASLQLCIHWHSHSFTPEL
jgi:hypothetical protein